MNSLKIKILTARIYNSLLILSFFLVRNLFRLRFKKYHFSNLLGEKNIETLQLQFIFEPFLRIGCVDCGDACQQNGRIASLIKSIWLTLYVIICHEFNFISNTIDLVGIYLDKSLVNETDLVLKFEFWSRGRHSCWSVANKKSTNTTKVLIQIEMILKSILWGASFLFLL